ncbi:hypothetical protein FRACYDRAFT_242356 [Fragilariopsis cylindrus CCMP1102]|uniref:Uncharacterized protein n=1 Tax=Fragilariopsis cylindrus CCMP1102 TaxID=635003 RepID=A0A1E7F818_9STRA|nr:hypothetical protein FRACYDRAFT_242356 [Fragilariopsis cylindrus CCMP1102]|eukprot:OEU14003.1 hypothetical protein FRACYDRAFT_242356 [Fragilariopsis cylindrus CCMP1102]
MPEDDCEQYSVRRSRCHDVYGNRGEECLHEELTEKRCISMQRCPRQAIEYYELEYGEHVAIHHKEAHEIVSNDTKLRKECRQIAMDLALCLLINYYYKSEPHDCFLSRCATYVDSLRSQEIPTTFVLHVLMWMWMWMWNKQ